EVRDHDLGSHLVQAREAGFGVRRDIDVIAGAGKRLLQHLEQRGIVVDNQNAGERHSVAAKRARGKESVNRVPSPGEDSHSIPAPCSWRIWRASAMPRPVPPVFVLKKGRKSWARASCDMPLPVSSITHSTRSALARVRTRSVPPEGMASMALRT